MISAPNHRLRLNGSKAIAICLVMLLMYACKTAKQQTSKPPVVKSPPETEKEENVLQYDPALDTVIAVPRSAILIDTIKWIEDKTPPMVSDEPKQQTRPDKNEIAEIALLIPFNTLHADFLTEHQDPKLNRFIHYYAGIDMAMDNMDSLGLKVKVSSIDADAAGMSMAQLMLKEEVKKADVIVGPYEREEIEAMASFGLSNEIMVVSPWFPAFTVEKENPFFIQLFPGLSTHADAIMRFIREEMPGKKVYVVARDNAAELNRIQLFKRNPDVHPKELLIKDASPDLLNTNLHDLLSDDAGTIFILPYFSKGDETFVNSFMRKLHADKDTREAIVFGLPQWTGYTNLNANYMESLSAHLSISSFIDVASSEYEKFKIDFFHQYHTVPDLNAFLGYDLMMWLGHQLDAYGQEGLIVQMDRDTYGLASGFDIQPVYKLETENTAEMKTPLYYENRMIRIIRFVDQDFVLVR